MTSEEFIMWLRGYMQALKNTLLTEEHVEDISYHLACVDLLRKNSIVFDPTYNPNTSAIRFLPQPYTVSAER